MIFLLLLLVCGAERWPVKTLSDTNRTCINYDTATPITISAINTLPDHCHPARALTRFFPEEFILYTVTGYARSIKRERDRDYHIALYQDNDAESPSVVAEVVDPRCAMQSPELPRLIAAWQELAALHPLRLRGQRVTVVGVGFFDREHGQVGMSSSCMELHPILSIRKEGVSP